VRWLAVAALAIALLAQGAVALSPRADAATPVPLSVRIREKQKLVELTRLRLERKRGQLHQARYKVLTISQQLDATNYSISRVEDQIAALSYQIEKTQMRLQIRRRQLAATRASLDRHRGALGDRLRGMYEYGPASYLDVLLNSTSFTDFVERWDLLRYILHSDGVLIARINVEAEHYATMVDALAATEATLSSQEQDQQRKRSELGVLADERQQLLAAAQAQKSVIATQVVQLENLTAAEEARLQALIAEKQREDAAAVCGAQIAAAQARRAAAAAAGLPPPIEHPCTSAPGVFSWPAHGPITSPFGYRISPITGGREFHTGIDIGADYGAPILASADGIVIYAGWYGGYGNVEIIDHGSGLSTLYAHCSVLYAVVNQRVQRGQVIALVGATGWATGPHLHFEIRVNGVPVDPLTRL